MNQVAFNRADLLGAMEELAERVDAAGVHARICVIGGAALAMGYYDRLATQDVDCLIDARTCDPADVWDPDNPAAGHCGVTAMAILEIFGGELLEADVWRANGQRNGVHYWNRLSSGLELDLTRDQFRNDERLTEPVVRVPNRSPNARMAPRYNVFAERVRLGLGTVVPRGCTGA